MESMIEVLQFLSLLSLSVLCSNSFPGLLSISILGPNCFKLDKAKSLSLRKVIFCIYLLMDSMSLTLLLYVVRILNSYEMLHIKITHYDNGLVSSLSILQVSHFGHKCRKCQKKHTAILSMSCL
jgi:hypothetical protein